MGTKRILLVDDEVLILYALSRTLATAGVEVIPVGSAEEALAEVDRQPFNVCLLDHVLPGMSGIDVIPLLRAKAPTMKIVVITASRLTPGERATVDAMAVAFLEKPFDVKRVKALVDDMLHGSPAPRPAHSGELARPGLDPGG